MAMRILLFTPKYFPVLSGNTFTADRIARGIRDEGHAVQVTTMKSYYAQLKRFKPDIVHFLHATKSPVNKGKVPYVLTLTGTDIDQDLYKAKKHGRLRKSLAGAAHVTTFKRINIKTVAKALSIPTPAHSVIPQAVYLPRNKFDFRRHFNLSKNDLVFLLVASIRNVKDPLYAIEELKYLHSKNPSVKLVTLGEIDDLKMYKHILKQHLHWIRIGTLNHKYMHNAYMQSDLILNTSQSEGQSNAVLEAISLHRVVLASDVTGNEIVPKKYRFPKSKFGLCNVALRQLKHRQKPVYNHRIPTIKQEAKQYTDIYKSILKS